MCVCVWTRQTADQTAQQADRLQGYGSSVSAVYNLAAAPQRARSETAGVTWPVVCVCVCVCVCKQVSGSVLSSPLTTASGTSSTPSLALRLHTTLAATHVTTGFTAGRHRQANPTRWVSVSARMNKAMLRRQGTEPEAAVVERRRLFDTVALRMGVCLTHCLCVCVCVCVCSFCTTLVS